MELQFTIIWKDRLASTNTTLGELAEKTPGLSSGTVIAAREQTRGRGRFDRLWLSGKNENLTFSLFLRVGPDSDRLPSVSMAAAVAAADLLESEGIQAALKWPNDVLVNGKKICGILSESVSGGIIIGVGLNVNLDTTTHIDQPATSMRIETGKPFDCEQLLPVFLEKLTPHLAAWEHQGFLGIRANWESRASNLGKPIRLRDGENDREGVLAGFGEDGELLLQTAESTCIPVWSGELTSPPRTRHHS
jgi:BirA family transcriptional regulator, biotin operon repressor / biotin---[acetyl-CoA-carboxylase] ligase